MSEATKLKLLENVAINDVLPLIKDARRDAIANLKCFSGPGTPAMSTVLFTFAKRRHLITFASAPFTSSRMAKFGWVPFAVYNTWQRSRAHNLRRVGEISGAILTRLWTKVYENFK